MVCLVWSFSNNPNSCFCVLVPVGLEVLGHEANEIWGQQWVKMLALLYEGVTVGLGDGDMFIGGRSSEGNAARVRVQLEVERIMTGVP